MHVADAAARWAATWERSWTAGTVGPITALYGLDGGDRVLYVGSFSKAMFPALRLAYLVAPPRLADAVAQAERLKDTHNILLAMNSLWAWYSALPEDQQQAIGTFGGKRPHIKLWTSARLRVQRGEQL